MVLSSWRALSKGSRICNFPEKDKPAHASSRRFVNQDQKKERGYRRIQWVRCRNLAIRHITVVSYVDVIGQDQEKVNLHCCVIFQRRTLFIKSLDHRLCTRNPQLDLFNCIYTASPEKIHIDGSRQNQRCFVINVVHEKAELFNQTRWSTSPRENQISKSCLYEAIITKGNKTTTRFGQLAITRKWIRPWFGFDPPH